MKLVTVILDSSSKTSSGVRNLETTHFPLYSRLGAKCGAVERRPSRDFREARFWLVSYLPTIRPVIPIRVRVLRQHSSKVAQDSVSKFCVRLSESNVCAASI